jgi:NAD(P)-dependent dehydrogenase (short-subunit alcohol dehydrogenase family)
MADDKNAVVTGASKGIGLAVATALRDEGYRVVAGARTISTQLSEITPFAISVDLSTPGGPGYLIEAAMAELGGIDLLVNNVAGTTGPHPDGFLSISDDDWQHALDMTLFSAIRASRAALPSIVERNGHIINIGSVNSRRPAPHLADISAPKRRWPTSARPLRRNSAPAASGSTPSPQGRYVPRCGPNRAAPVTCWQTAPASHAKRSSTHCQPRSGCPPDTSPNQPK